MLKSVVMIAVALTVGCATVPRPVPITTAEVTALAKAGTTDADIIAQIDQTRAVFQLTAADVVRLRTEGVSDAVINYMLATHPRWVARQERAYSYHYWGPPYPAYWGPAPYPVFVIHPHRHPHRH